MKSGGPVSSLKTQGLASLHLIPHIHLIFTVQSVFHSPVLFVFVISLFFLKKNLSACSQLAVLCYFQVCGK